MSKKMKGILLTISGGICWGISGSIGQFLFTHENMDSKWLIPIRLILAGIILLVYSYYRYGIRVIQPWNNGKDRLLLLIYGLAGISLCQYFYFLTIQLSNAGIGTILQSLSPVMIVFVYCFMNRRIPSIREILSVIFALTGVFLITTHGKPNTFLIPANALITGLLSAVCVTVYNIVPKKLLIKYPVVILQGWAFILGGVLFTILFKPWTFHYVPTWIGIIGIIGIILIGSVFAFTWYMSGVALIGAESGVLYGYAEPVTAAIITVVFFGSSFTIYDLFGFIFIFLMLVMVTTSDRK